MLVNFLKMSLLNTFWTTLYIWLRPLVKWVLRRTTRLCELQRICYGEEKGALRTLQIEYSLSNTRTPELKKAVHILNNKAKDKTVTQDVIYYAVFAIVRIKNINIKIHKRFPEMLGGCIMRIWGYRQMLSRLEDLRTTAYDSNNSEHEEKLLKLWSCLQPKTYFRGKGRISKQWQEIGFQGNDPATDFRGMGMLGLENLLYFAETHPNAAQHVLLRSQHPVYGYSFAIVGINISHTAYMLAQEGLAKTHFYNSSKGFPDQHAFHQFFCYLFFEFDVLWRHEKPKDIMEFNHVKSKFEKNIRAKLKDPMALFKCHFVLENI
ncbi:ELMO domain-containing protein 1 [Armadillidium vulgare]|nr:ELMO domain-containing protein 1 [Armadillidium vulgare]